MLFVNIFSGEQIDIWTTRRSGDRTPRPLSYVTVVTFFICAWITLIFIEERAMRNGCEVDESFLMMGTGHYKIKIPVRAALDLHARTEQTKCAQGLMLQPLSRHLL